MVARYAFVTLAWLFLACVAVQVFLAGLGVFAGAATFATHRDFGYTFGFLTVFMLIAAGAGRLGRRWIWFSALLIFLFALQSLFVGLRGDLPTVAALHPVNALAIFWVAQHVARGALSLVREQPAASVSAEGAGARP
jgi:hypothetical protein